MSQRAAAILVLSFAASAWADIHDVTVTTDKTVYSSGTKGKVRITLENNSKQTVLLDTPKRWAVEKDSFTYKTYFVQPYMTSLWPPPPLVVAPGKSTSWEWDKSDYLDRPVPPGSYTVTVGPMRIGKDRVTLSHVIALTKTGKIFSDDFFPLAQGNEWIYQVQNPLGTTFKTMSVERDAGDGWWKIRNFEPRSSKTGAYKIRGHFFPALMVQIPKPPAPALAPPEDTFQKLLTLVYVIGTRPAPRNVDLFLFGRPDGYRYTVNVEPYLTHATFECKRNKKADIPAGHFTNCYGLNVDHHGTSLLHDFQYRSFLFAPGIGLVQYSTNHPFGKPVIYSLYRATITGSDGKKYTIGKRE